MKSNKCTIAIIVGGIVLAGIHAYMIKRAIKLEQTCGCLSNENCLEDL